MRTVSFRGDYLREANDDSATQAELLCELEDVKNQLDMIYHINKLAADFEPVEERILSPAEKVFGIQNSIEESISKVKPGLSRAKEYSPFS